MIYLYLSNQRMQIVTTKKNEIVTVINEELPQKLILNGFIQDNDELVNALKTIVNKYALSGKKVNLVIDSTLIIYRELQTPILSKEELNKFVYFSLNRQIPNLDNYVVDYTILNKTSTNIQLLAVGVSSVLIKSYEYVLNKLNLKLNKISTSTMSLFKYHFSLKTNESAILMYVNDDIVSSLIISNNIYSYANITRLMDKDNDARINLLTKISTLLQFQNSQNKHKIDTLYVFMDTTQTISLDTNMLNGIKTITNIDISNSSLSADGLIKASMAVFDTYSYPFKTLNLKKGLKQYKKVKNVSINLIGIMGMILALNILFIGGSAAKAYYDMEMIKRNTKKINILIDDPTFNKRYEEAFLSSEASIKINEKLSEFKNIYEQVRNDKFFKYDMYSTIMAQLGKNVEIVKISLTKESFNLDLTATKAEDTYAFIQSLEASDKFEEVTYTGFKYNDNAKLYEFSLVLKSKAGV